MANNTTRTYWVRPYQQSAPMARGAKLLGVGERGQVFALVDSQQPDVPRLITVVLEDHTLGPYPGQYIGSFAYGGTYAHVFDDGEPDV